MDELSWVGLGALICIVAGFMLGFWFNMEERIEYQKQIEQLEQERDTYKQLVLDKVMEG